MKIQKINLQFFIILLLKISLIISFDCSKILYCDDCNTDKGCVECEDNYFPNSNGTCDECSDLIAHCDICEKVEDKISCSRCEYYFEQSDTQNQKCINSGCIDKENSRCTQCTPDQLSCTSCGEGYYLTNDESKNGYSNCEPCFVSIEGCKKCSSDGKICYECYESEEYKLNLQQKCEKPKCSPLCLECADDDRYKCIKCNKSQYLTQNHECQSCSDLHSSCTECSNWWSCTKCTGFIEDEISNEHSCDKCALPGCFYCSSDGKECLECNQNMELYFDKTCQHYDCPLLDNCYKCTPDGKSCRQCNGGQYQLYETTNEIGEYINSCATCDQIIQSCRACNRNNFLELVCSSCSSGYLSLDQKQCLSECELNQVIFYQQQDNICQCSELFYYNTDINKCTTECPQYFLGNSLDNTCIFETYCEGYISSDNKRCLDKCPILEIVIDSEKQQCQKQTTLSTAMLSKALITIIQNTNQESIVTQLSDYIDTILVQEQQSQLKIYSLLSQSVFALQNEISKTKSLQKIERQSEDYAITILSISETYRFNCLAEIDKNENIRSSPYLMIQEHSKCNEIDSDTLSIILSKRSKEFVSASNITTPYISFGLQSSSNRIQQQSSTQFKVNIPVNVTNNDINKYWCITMLNNQPQSSIKSFPNPNNSTITCSFVNNTSIIYDEQCEYVNQSFCQKDNQNNNLSTLSIVFIVVGVLLGIIITVITYICIKKRKQAKQVKYERAQTIDSFSDSNENAVN